MSRNSQSQKLAREAGSTRYLSVKLGGRRYALHASMVEEIVELRELKKLPGAPNYVMGFMPHRGRVLIVVDLRKRYNLPQPTPPFRACVVIVNIQWQRERQTIGLYVEEADDLIVIADDELEPIPTLQFALDTNYLDGLLSTIKTHDSVEQGDDSSAVDEDSLLILNLTRLFNDSEWQKISDSASQ